MFSKCICHRHCLSHYFYLARSSLWPNVSKVKSLKDRSLKVFSKCICHCLCLSCCLFVGQVMFSHHSDQMPQWSKVPKIALWRCSLNVFVIGIVFAFFFVVVSQWVSEWVTKVGLELLGQLRNKMEPIGTPRPWIWNPIYNPAGSNKVRAGPFMLTHTCPVLYDSDIYIYIGEN